MCGVNDNRYCPSLHKRPCNVHPAEPAIVRHRNCCNTRFNGAINPSLWRNFGGVLRRPNRSANTVTFIPPVEGSVNPSYNTC
eukprot:scaffold6480_cov165-Amphora_coffeaeformis.AAC.5